MWKRTIIRRLAIALLGIFSIFGVPLLFHLSALPAAANAQLDAVLVLGGSIRREVYVAQLARDWQTSNRTIPILISGGSDPPCTVKVFHLFDAPKENVWLEKCATSTFDNFYFSVPIIKQWQARKIKLITSETHLPRAAWLAKVLFAAQGIWVEVDLAKEIGIPANQESTLKTILDVTRSLLWAVVSQLYTPKCDRLQALSTVNMERWQERGFDCEPQSDLPW
ncbi:YdcF family protein [Geitlerinema sp. PCC 9228]|uniref:YdcF family protein n=1 Tax=Geitlerinema sp. PCC 9228 TaxID=111611 RepID=UPI0008F986B5|nr:YdcF family protein [Geitlerinema sp. PCC 9228]